MLLTIGKYLMAAALTLAVVTTVFVMLFFREKPESAAASEPVAETTAEAAEPEDYSQPWLDIPDPEPVAETGKPTTSSDKVASGSAKAVSRPGKGAASQSGGEAAGTGGVLDMDEYGPMPGRQELQVTRKPRHFQLAPGVIMGLTVPKMRIYNAPVYDSDRQWALDNGVAHVPETSLPWDDGPQKNVYLAGHRLGWPRTGSYLVFYRLNTLGKGDLIVLKDRRGRTYRYRVTETFIASPDDSWVMGQVRGRDMVTLQTCTPIPTFDKRIIVRADRI